MGQRLMVVIPTGLYSTICRIKPSSSAEFVRMPSYIIFPLHPVRLVPVEKEYTVFLLPAPKRSVQMRQSPGRPVYAQASGKIHEFKVKSYAISPLEGYWKTTYFAGHDYCSLTVSSKPEDPLFYIVILLI